MARITRLLLVLSHISIKETQDPLDCKGILMIEQKRLDCWDSWRARANLKRYINSIIHLSFISKRHYIF